MGGEHGPGSKIALKPFRLDPGVANPKCHGERGPWGGAVSANPEKGGYTVGISFSWAGANWFASFLSHP